jgi:hypothetical protein
MSAKARLDPSRHSTPRKPMQGMKPQFQSGMSTTQEFSLLSSTAQDGCYSPQDTFSLFSPVHQSHNNHELNSWSRNDGMLPSPNPSESGEELFERSSIPTTESNAQVSTFCSYTEAHLQPCTSYSSHPELDAISDPCNSSNVDFSIEGYPALADLYNTGPIGHNPQELDETHGYIGPGPWAHLTEDYSSAPLSRLSSAIPGPPPISPPLTEASNDACVTLACPQSNYSTYVGQEDPGLVDMSPAGSHFSQNNALGSPCLSLTPLSGQDLNRLAILARHVTL